MTKPILALLQNQWFKDPERVAKFLEGRTNKFRRSFIERALFAGCRTGRVISKYFSEYLDQMVFEETSRRIGGFASSQFEADLDHIREAIKEVDPIVIIGFGSIANQALREIDCGIKMIHAPHPAARFGVADEFNRVIKGLNFL